MRNLRQHLLCEHQVITEKTIHVPLHQSAHEIRIIDGIRMHSLEVGVLSLNELCG